MTIAADVQSLTPAAIVDLFVLDLTDLGGDVSRYHAGTNELSAAVVWQGETYTPFPVAVSGFEQSGSGALPRPTLRISNLNGLVGALAREYGDAIGAQVTRKRTLIKYLDAANFDAGNPEADPNTHLPDEVYYVHRKVAETKELIEFELAAAWDVQGVKLPRRQVIQNICPWRYRGANCGYAGGAVADERDIPTNDADEDECGKRLRSCRLRFGENAELPFGGFPGSGLVR